MSRRSPSPKNDPPPSNPPPSNPPPSNPPPSNPPPTEPPPADTTPLDPNVPRATRVVFIDEFDWMSEATYSYSGTGSVPGIFHNRPRVAVYDQFDAMMGGEPVRFTSSTGGEVSMSSVLTGIDSDGWATIAQSPEWTLTSGSPVLTARAGTATADFSVTVVSQPRWQMSMDDPNEWGTLLPWVEGTFTPPSPLFFGNSGPNVYIRAVDNSGNPVARARLRCPDGPETYSFSSISGARGPIDPRLLTVWNYQDFDYTTWAPRPPSTNRFGIRAYNAHDNYVPSGMDSYQIACYGESGILPWPSQGVQIIFRTSLVVSPWS